MRAIRQQDGWDSIPLRYVCQLNPPVDFTGLEGSDDLTFLPMDRVKSGYFIPSTDKLIKYVPSYNAFEEGDIILAKVTPCFENGNIAIAEDLVNGKGFGSSELFVIRPMDIERKFLFYYFQAELDASGIYLESEVDEFARIFFAPKKRQSPADHRKMNAILDQAVARFVHLRDSEEEEAENWRGKVQAFRNLYGFLSQVIPYQDSELEKLYTYLRHLALKLPKRKTGPGYQFDEEVELDYYRLQKISEGSINLSDGYARPLDGPREVGTAEVREEYVTLSRLIDIINERFGTELNEADQLFFDQIAEAASQNEDLRKAAEVNPLDKFQLVFQQVLESLFIERMELNEELFTHYISKPELQELISKWLGSQVYDRLVGLKASNGRT